MGLQCGPPWLSAGGRHAASVDPFRGGTAPVNVHFVILRPESRRGRHAVRLPLLVGRGLEAKFRIQQERVSRRHCEFTAADGIVLVRDLGSRNGTLLDGVPVPVDACASVRPGAVLRVGSLEFRVEYDALAEKPTAEFDPRAAASSPTLAMATGDPGEVEIRVDSADPSSAPPSTLADRDRAGADSFDGFLEGLS